MNSFSKKKYVKYLINCTGFFHTLTIEMKWKEWKNWNENAVLRQAQLQIVLEQHFEALCFGNRLQKQITTKNPCYMLTAVTYITLFCKESVDIFCPAAFPRSPVDIPVLRTFVDMMFFRIRKAGTKGKPGKGRPLLLLQRLQICSGHSNKIWENFICQRLLLQYSILQSFSDLPVWSCLLPVFNLLWLCRDSLLIFHFCYQIF